MCSSPIPSLQRLFSCRDTPPPYPSHFRGRGIVISGGGSYLPSTYIAIRSIRSAGCTLPIQVWYLGVEELPIVLHPLFEQHGVELVNSHEIRKTHPVDRLGGWENKPFSILHSPFREVLSVDADNMVLADPTHLFEDPTYRSTGAIFWPDFLSQSEQYWMIKPAAWDMLGLPRRWNEEFESGQLLIDKEKSWVPFSLALIMNEESHFFYDHCTYGDKDTYRLAWDLAGVDPCVIQHRPTLREEMIRIQYSPQGEPLFQHARKWVVPCEKNPHLPSYLKEQESLCWLKEFERYLSSIG